MEQVKLTEDAWKYATYEGTECLQFEQTAKMSMPERLAALDEMLGLVASMKQPSSPRVL